MNMHSVLHWSANIPGVNWPKAKRGQRPLYTATPKVAQT